MISIKEIRGQSLLFEYLQLLQEGFDFRLQMQVLDLLVSPIERLHLF
jgi:hypothetical protein